MMDERRIQVRVHYQRGARKVRGRGGRRPRRTPPRAEGQGPAHVHHGRVQRQGGEGELHTECAAGVFL